MPDQNKNSGNKYPIRGMQTTGTPVQQSYPKWSAVFYWENYDTNALPSLDWLNAKYIIWTEGINRRGVPQLVGYIQFKSPIIADDLVKLNNRIIWTEQKASNTSAMNYIRRINGEMNGKLTEIGEHWPIRVMQRNSSPNLSDTTTPK